jgi:hypothetical protein
MRESINFLNLPKNIKVEGLFRVSGMKAVIDKLHTQVKKKDFKLPENQSAHNVAGLIKLLLREDYQPLITKDLTNLFTTATSCMFLCLFHFYLYILYYRSVTDALRSCCYGLPEEIKDILIPFFFFLHLVTQYSNITKMTVKNLRLVFTPVLFADFQDKSNFISIV